ncbi:hypothetical protein [Catenulispora sp. GP43]|uniref:hypothetical protein n=1 Tax=Catenulispora sp. GP43 TaxID=3156263 RepID=UPI003511DD42
MARIVSSWSVLNAADVPEAPDVVPADGVPVAAPGTVVLVELPGAVGAPPDAPFDVLLQAPRLATNDAAIAATAAVAMRERIFVPLPNDQAVACMTRAGAEG